MNFVSREAVAYAALQFLWSQENKRWGGNWKRALGCVLHHRAADSERTWLCKDILFLSVPSRPFVNTDGPDPPPRCAKMTNTVCPATPIFCTSVFLFPQIFLSFSSKYEILHLARGSFTRGELLPSTNTELPPFIISKLPQWLGSFYHKLFYKKDHFRNTLTLLYCLHVFFLHYLSCIWFLSLLMVSALGWDLSLWAHVASESGLHAMESLRKKTLLAESCPGRSYHGGFKD